MTPNTEAMQEIYEAAVHAEATGDDQDACFELLCKLENIGGTGATIRTLIDMVRAANREAQPVEWGSPKTVRQLIGQLQTLDPSMETTALLRMPADILDGNAIRRVPITISFEKLDGQWLVPYKGDGRKVLAFWAKADHREKEERGELFTAPPAPAVPSKIGMQEAQELFNYLMTEEELNATVNGYNACRAEMLAQPVSQGYKLVPVEPTPKQWAAGVKAMDTGMDKVTLVYKAMLATAPTQGENQ